jgi:membrane peptidoglycan carboxypeptidase
MSPKDRLAARLGTGAGTGAAAAGGYGGPGQYGPQGAAGRRPAGQWQAPDQSVRNGGRNGGGRGGNGGRGGGNGGPGGGRGPGGRGGRGRNGRVPRKGDWWRHWSLKKALFTACATGGGFFILLLGLVGYAYATTPMPVDASQAALQQSSVVYFRDGHTVVGTFGTTDRQMLTENQIPAVVKNAVVAIEDKHFYHEGGISPVGIVRAAIADVTSGSVAQGGSTLTQEFVRNYYNNIGTAQTVSRKLKEIFVAEKLAQQKSKDWILTQYLNTIPMGGNIYGFGAASESYFGIPATKLDVAQAAMLAAKIQSPNGFGTVPGSPGYSALVYRWHAVLTDMVTMGTLSASEAAAQKFPTVVPDPSATNWTGYRGYIMQAVQYELTTTYHYTTTQIDTGGLHIVTTFDQHMMNALYASVNQNEALMAKNGKGMPTWAHVGAVLEQPGTGQIWAMYSGPSYSEPTSYCKKIDCQFDMAWQNREQVGSSFKPYVLALARSQGMSVKTSVLDGYSPLFIPPVWDPMTYASRTQPANSAGYYQVGNDAGDGSLGPESVVNSTAMSLNTAYTDLYHRVAGPTGGNIVNMVSALGVNTDASGLTGSNAMKEEVGTALGQVSLTVEEQATTFAAFANDGVYVDPHVILKIYQGTAVTNAMLMTRAALTPAEASDVDYALSFDTQPGLGTAASAALSDGRPIIAKTGTTNLSQSAFFIGAIPQFSLAVGMFTDQQGCPSTVVGCAAAANQESAPPAGVQTLYGIGGLQGYGGQYPAAIWHTFAEKEFLQMPAQNFPAPDFGGSAWSLLPPAPPQPAVHNTPGPGHCHGNGRHCHGNQAQAQAQAPANPANPANPLPTTPVTTLPPVAAAALKSSSGA